MAKLSFSERYKQDRHFREAADNLQREAVFVALGIDPEAVVKAWSADKRKITKTPAQLIEMPGGYAVAQVAPAPVEGDGPPRERTNPVADMNGDEAKAEIENAAGRVDREFLEDVRDLDERATVATAAHRALFDLRTAG